MHATQPPTPDSTDTPTVPPVTALRLAADYLDQHGWIQRDYYLCGDCAEPAACALGALAIACYGQPIADPFDDKTNDGQEPADLDHIGRWHDFMTAHHALTAYLNRSRAQHEVSIDTWNDTVGRRLTDVLTTLREAADHIATTTPNGQVAP